ncbi:glycosyltransferase domain-containing protein [Stappia sp. MMSF_3263]|uniref:glycosyltransferase domain-containing protein n=1 Tax=Stappia sp. MMSF_3263 TaxID=3046693 RepID=UPI00273F88DF|nr:glycosyltransferase domain-containing protein [Stappia sp. MMSF_3263]
MNGAGGQAKVVDALPRFVTLASHEGPGLDRYRASLARFGIVPDIVWTGSPYPGHLAAMQVLRAHLSGLPGDEIVVYTDGYDVALIRDPAELVARYRAFASPIVISTEPGFTWKLPGRFAASRRYPKGTGRSGMYRYLNSGGYIGKAGALATMLAGLDYASGIDCDQTLLNKWFLENPGRVALDYDQEIFASSACQSGLERKLYRFDGTHLVNTRTGGRPFFFHFPAENRLCARHVLDMLPFDLPRLPVRPRDRCRYVLNVIESRPTYWLDRPAYPLEDIVGLVAFRLLPVSIVAGLGFMAWHAVA